MKPLTLLLAGAALMLVPGPAQAQDSAVTLSLAQAARRALATHPATRAAAARFEGAEAAVGEARAARLPSVSLSASATTWSDPMLVAPLHGFDPAAAPAFDETLIQGGVTASYTLFDGGARGARIRQARAEAGAGEAGLARAEQGLLARVTVAYLDVLTRARILGASEQRLAALHEEHARVTKLHAAGRAAQLELRRAEAALADGRAEQTRHATALAVARLELGRLVDDSAAVPGRLEDVRLRDSTVPARSAIIAAAVAASPEVEEARRRAAAAGAAAAVVRGTRWPTASLTGGYTNRGGADSDFADEWNAGVQLAWPLFTGGATARRVDRADAAGRAAGEEVRLAELDAAARADHALAQLTDATARITSLTEAVEAFAAVAAAERLRLETGTGMQADYLTAEADLLGARAELARTDYDRLAAAVELARLMGRLDLAWIETELEQQP